MATATRAWREVGGSATGVISSPAGAPCGKSEKGDGGCYSYVCIM